MTRGVYIHIPFCHQICNYCDFNKFYFKNQPVDEYIASLGKEMKLMKEKFPETFTGIETIFLGGGTPTALDEAQLQQLMDYIHETIPMENVLEFSSEANPDELTEGKLRVLKENGVNRLSLGVQSFDQDLLKKIGRTHDNEHVFETIALAKKVGFENISIDLMYGLPNQTMAQWQHSLQTAFSLNLPHYSAYSLIVEPKTIFYNLYNRGKLPLPGEDREAEMYKLLMDEMEAHGLQQYEISNFGRAGFESKHNMIYWDNDSYFGFGAGASGYVAGKRYTNHAPLKKYMQAIEANELPMLHEHLVTKEEAIEEQLFLGLRKVQGVSCQQFEERFNISMEKVFAKKIETLEAEGLVQFTEHALQLTKKGRFVGNEVFQQFLLD